MSREKRESLMQNHRESKEQKIIMFLALLVIILSLLLFGIWPRNGNSLVNPFINEDAVSMQMMQIDQANINQLEEQQSSSEVILASSSVSEVEYAYNITQEEYELLLSLVYCEGNTESIECQMAILQVVFNRLESSDFPNTIHDVVFQEGQFEPVKNGILENAKPNVKNAKALGRVLRGEKVVPSNVLYFWATDVNASSSRAWFDNMYKNNFYSQIDNTYFFYG